MPLFLQKTDVHLSKRRLRFFSRISAGLYVTILLVIELALLSLRYWALGPRSSFTLQQLTGLESIIS